MVRPRPGKLPSLVAVHTKAGRNGARAGTLRLAARLPDELFLESLHPLALLLQSLTLRFKQLTLLGNQSLLFGHLSFEEIQAGRSRGWNRNRGTTLNGCQGGRRRLGASRGQRNGKVSGTRGQDEKTRRNRSRPWLQTQSRHATNPPCDHLVNPSISCW